MSVGLAEILVGVGLGLVRGSFRLGKDAGGLKVGFGLILGWLRADLFVLSVRLGLLQGLPSPNQNSHNHTQPKSAPNRPKGPEANLKPTQA